MGIFIFLGIECCSLFCKCAMTNIIPFPSKANTEPVIDADYWGSEKICFTDLFKILEEINNAKNSDVQT